MEETIKESFSRPNLPLEMMQEILLRLPVKSLSRFKCVCISWRSLIIERLFTLKHASILEVSKATTCKKSPYGVITTSRHHVKSCCIHSLYNDSSMVNVLDHDGELLGRDYYKILGTCHGLICLHVNKRSLYLWNPTIKIQERLFGSDLETKDDIVVTYGFGYDECKDDYKVVALFQKNQESKTEAKIYSTRRKMWCENVCFPNGVVLANKSRTGIYINGTINWSCTYSSSSLSVSIIISYDISRDVFKEVQGPVSCNRSCLTLTLGDLRGSLCMVCYCKGANADVWVMKKFGVRESWFKLLSIPGLTEFVRPVWVVSNDLVVLLEFRSGLALYNCGNGRFQYPVLDRLSGCRDAKVYVKTMVSPSSL